MECEFSNAGELILQIHSNSRWSFNGHKGSIRLQLKYGLFKMLGCKMGILSSAQNLSDQLCVRYVSIPIQVKAREGFMEMDSSQVDDGGKWTELDSILKTQLEVIIFISCSGSDGHVSANMSAPASCSVGDDSGGILARASGLTTDSSYPLYCMMFMSVPYLKNKFEKIIAGRVFDRGRLLELIMRSTKFFLDTVDPCIIVLQGSKMIAEYRGYVFLLLQNGGSLEACELFVKTLQQVNVLCTNLILHMTREDKSGKAQELFYQLLVGDNSPIQMKGTLQRLKIIIRKFNCLVFSSQLGFTVFSLGLWSMGNDNDYVLIVTESQPGAPCCIGFGIHEWCLGWRKSLVRVVGIIEMLVVFKSGEIITQELREELSKKATGVFTRQKNAHLRCFFMVIQIAIYKGASGVIDGTVLGKVVFDKGLNHWHKEVVGAIEGQLKHGVFGGAKEVICRMQSY
ncbi:hypothetical protein MKW98_000701 [Papaver atlanticum]|uniref:Uncharacterized protein n=1 Tax=Papaver atlanticum TaxID=357466 RepID=A0AAD4S2C1_9MAGN|nr:hypothetical protein MKW98_000701 [Papaver atlanticum]